MAKNRDQQTPPPSGSDPDAITPFDDTSSSAPPGIAPPNLTREAVLYAALKKAEDVLTLMANATLTNYWAISSCQEKAREIMPEVTTALRG